jgi:hypothetical protein
LTGLSERRLEELIGASQRLTFRVPATGTLAVGSAATRDITSFVNRAKIREIRVASDPSNLSTSYAVELYERDTFASARLAYQFTGINHRLRDIITGIGMDYRDLDETSELHARIVNNGGAASFFDFIIIYEPTPNA